MAEQKMEEKTLLGRICFNLGSMAGFLKLVHPDVYEELFHLEKEFSQDELKLIFSLAKQESDRAAAELLAELKGEDDGSNL